MIARSYLIVASIFALAGILAGCDPQPASDAQSSPAGEKSSSADKLPAVSLTPEAAARVKAIMADADRTGKCVLRLRVVPGGCQGFMHKLDLDLDTSAEDYLCESRGIKVALFKRQLGMLRGTEVDFVRRNDEEGFKVENPNFKGECAKKWLTLLEKEKDVKER
jgi:iron-sulfur cluster assembly protein